MRSRAAFLVALNGVGGIFGSIRSQLGVCRCISDSVAQPQARGGMGGARTLFYVDTRIVPYGNYLLLVVWTVRAQHLMNTAGGLGAHLARTAVFDNQQIKPKHSSVPSHI